MTTLPRSKVTINYATTGPASPDGGPFDADLGAMLRRFVFAGVRTRKGERGDWRVYDREAGDYISRAELGRRMIKCGGAALVRRWYGNVEMKQAYDAPHDPPPPGSALATATVDEPSAGGVVR